ncbi:hypothetical protein H4Q26_013792 [Puccinia striiformis f. sp. tritici PST-130]|nr:hypothetical protein H4Q26_013792 [Puccinia striiformis f. sp. tritici PST-130]
MRKVLRAAGAVGQSTALLTNKIKDNTDPRKLSEQILTNQKSYNTQGAIWKRQPGPI